MGGDINGWCHDKASHRQSVRSESNNGGWEDCCPFKAILCVASGAFFCHVHSVLPSESNGDLKEPSSDIQERSCVIGMSVVIMSAEHDWRTDFAS